MSRPATNLERHCGQRRGQLWLRHHRPPASPLAQENSSSLQPSVTRTLHFQDSIMCLLPRAGERDLQEWFLSRLPHHLVSTPAIRVSPPRHTRHIGPVQVVAAGQFVTAFPDELAIGSLGYLVVIESNTCSARL